MIIKIPFTKFYIGSRKAIAERRAISYGVYQNQISALSMSMSRYRIDFGTLYNIYNNVVEVKMAVRKLQNAICKNGLSYNFAGDADKDAGETEEAKALKAYLNYKYRFSTLKDLWVRDIGIAGNAYWHIERAITGKILGIVPVDPRTMYVVVDQYGEVVKYIQHIIGYEPIEFDPSEIIHFVLDYSTRNPALGVSPIEAIVWDARTEMASQMQSFFFYENNAVPSHLLILKEDITEKNAQTLKDYIEEQYRGPKNRFKAGIIPHVKDIKTVTPSQKEMQFLEHRLFNVKKIAVAFGVDPFLLGYTEGVQRSNGSIIRREFYENTARPYEKYLEQAINNELLPKIGLNRIQAKVNLSDYDDEDAIYSRSREDVKFGIVTINEARAMRGMKEMDNELADEPIFNGMLLDDLANDFEETKSEIKDRIRKSQKGIYDLLDKPII